MTSTKESDSILAKKFSQNIFK